MATKRVLLYWDSCVFIDCVQATPERYPVLESIVEAAKAGDVLIVTSAFAIAEVVKCEPDRAVTKEDADKIKAFFENDYISVRQLDRRIAEMAADFSRQHGIKPPDAVHVATAIRWKCAALQTYDGRNKKKKGKLLSYDGQIGVPALVIEIPRLPREAQHDEQGSLFDAKKEPTGESEDAEPPAALTYLARPCQPHPLRRISRLSRWVSTIVPR